MVMTCPWLNSLGFLRQIRHCSGLFEADRSPPVCREVVGWEDVAHQWEPDTGLSKKTSTRFVNVRGVLCIF
jgi:hypothetical protein